MAWRAFSISGIDYTYTPVDTNIYTQVVNVPSDNYNNIGQIITDITWVEKTSLHDVTLVSKDGYTITCNSLDSGRELSIQFTKPNEEYATVGGGRYLSGTTYVTFGFFIDDENEVATFAPYATNYNNATRWQSGTNMGRLTNSNWLYTFLKEIEPAPSSNWEQVFYGDNVFFSEGTIVNFDACTNYYTNSQGDTANLAFINQYLTGNMFESTSLPTELTEVFRHGEYYIKARQNITSGPGRGFLFQFGKDGEGLKLSFGYGGNGNKPQGFKFAVAINENEHKGAFVFGGITYDNYSANVGKIASGIDGNNTETNLYNWITNAMPVVPSTEAGAGSGYIGNSLLSNKKMVGYNVPTSSDESTKTESVEDASESPVSGKPKIGNGHVKIKQITTIKSNALFVGANTEVTSLHKGSSNRKYLKLYDDYSICVMYYDSNYQYYGPLFLSTSENGVKYKTTGDWTYESTDFSTTIINGVSWKLAWSRYWLPYPDNDEDWDLPVISGVLPNNADYWNYQYNAQEVTTLINAILNAAKE